MVIMKLAKLAEFKLAFFYKYTKPVWVQLALLVNAVVVVFFFFPGV